MEYLIKYKDYLLIYYGILNIYGWALMGMDKRRAKNHRWRIPEARLLMVGFLGGAVGLYIGMKGFRHKTKHKRFSWGIPVFIIVHFCLWVYFIIIA